MLAAALAFAERGWPVFPCSPKDKRPLLPTDKDAEGKPIKGSGGLKKASTDPAQIRAWWRKWPHALVAIATGHPTLDLGGLRLFVVDFDPRVHDETGEIFELEGLKEATEAQIGCALPKTRAAMTPSGGVHLYLLQGDDGPPITNRGNLPRHVDVRGLGGYVIAPPSVMGADAIKGQRGLRYRWLRGDADAPLALAPAALIEVLRSKPGPLGSHQSTTLMGAPPSGENLAGDQPAAASLPAPPARARSEGSHPSGDPAADAIRKYGLAALDEECRELAATPIGGGKWGGRNMGIYHAALKLGGLVTSRPYPALSEAVVKAALQAVIDAMPHNDNPAGARQTLENGLTDGMGSGRDLSEMAENARRRSARPRRATPPAPPQPVANDNPASFRPGREVGQSDGAGGAGEPALTDVERVRFTRASERWLLRRIEHVEPNAKALTALAFTAGRRVAAELLDANAVKEAIWPVCEDIADVQHEDIDRAIDDGIARGFDPQPLRLDHKCAGYPLTDFGLAERFRDRFGADFRFTTAKGWLGWDGRRWKVLDQDKDTPPAELIASAFETVRLLQQEGRAVADTGERIELVWKGEGKSKHQALDDADPDAAALDYWVLVGKSWKLFSGLLREFGRKSEVAGKPVAIANLARRWLTVPIEDFDCEQMAINVMNGTLRFPIETMADGTKKASVRRDKHRREDLITKLSPIVYDAEAVCPLYDGMFSWAQPEAEMQRYLHQIAGYSATGDTGEHLLWFNYGGGRNGKSTTIDAWCSTLGDYSGTIAIESFLDQGIKKRGDQATPDLAKLGGIRMLRASEPGRDAKLDSALIKAVTGGEPMSVRALHRGFFDLLPRFKLLMSGNSKPSIPDTDDGIWGRMKLVWWRRHIEKPDEDPFASQFPESRANWPLKDPQLLNKIKSQELPGVFNRILAGLIDYLEHRFVEPASVKEATEAYRDSSDPLARFLRLCTVHDPNGRIQSSKLHEVFVAWAKAAQEKEWSNKGLANAMADKGFVKKASDGMQWLGLRLIRLASDFVDEHGRVKAISSDLSTAPPNEGETPIERGASWRPHPDDDYVPGFDEP
ncbi:phage/plasmid primase, P4 family [Sphingosinicella sp. BN140058]|uniref:phage/plasmid primase, P4 family n=1 Tax=Sphingosinicella sp. BN140058 TaxID=1892855 RepID=UPI0013ED7676|nr:phage/plasmid primase, P4 family [Sphingosinicella sp. BN140058]